MPAFWCARDDLALRRDFGAAEIGEETGDLDKMLIKVADNYDNDVDVLVGSLISILEPVMVVVLGLLVGFIVIALFAPMVSLIQAVSSPGKK